jgi:hypothetical protein
VGVWVVNVMDVRMRVHEGFVKMLVLVMLRQGHLAECRRHLCRYYKGFCSARLPSARSLPAIWSPLGSEIDAVDAIG